MKKIVVLALVFAAAAGGSAFGNGKSDAKSAGLETVRIGLMTDSTVDYASQVGLANGTFEKYGIKLETASFAMGINTIDAVTTGQMDIGYGADFAVLNRFGGSSTTPLRIFCGVGKQKPISWTLFARGADIKSTADLAGKPVVTQLGTIIEYWLVRLLQFDGVDPATVTLLPVESPMEGVAMIQAGSAKAMITSATAAVEIAKIDGVHALANLGQTNIPPTVSMLLATEDFLTKRPQAAAKFLQALQEVYTFIAAHEQETAEIVHKMSNVPIEQVIRNLDLVTTYEIDFNEEYFTTIDGLYQWMAANKVIKYPYDLAGYVNTDALTAAFPGRGWSR